MTRFRRLSSLILILAISSTALMAQTHRRKARRTTHRRTTSTSTPATRTPVHSNSFLILDETPVVGVLNTTLSTRQARSGDTFIMNVTQPSQYSGATIEGHLSGVKRSGKISGRSEMTLNFDRIRLRNGDSYKFAGTLESVRSANGESTRVDNEGNVEASESQTSKTGKRAGIGGAAGLIIGAIAGGGKGAAIGTIIGAGAGAGSVYVGGRKDLELPSGTEVTIRASAPR
jgi:hypothetical protein